MDIWSLMLTLRIWTIVGRLTAAQQKMLRVGGGSLDANAERPKPAWWISEAAWRHIIQLSRSVPVYRDLPDAITRNDAVWKHWYYGRVPRVRENTWTSRTESRCCCLTSCCSCARCARTAHRLA
jgi:hypothetical protein